MTPLQLSSMARDVAVAEVCAWGTRGAETGGFFLSDDGGALTVVALPGAKGIVRHPRLFVVSGRALARLFRWAGDHELQIRVQFHSHGREAFLSETDLTHGFSVDGFVSTVLPFFRNPSTDPAAWGWWAYDAGGWRHTAPASLIASEARIVRFDEEGVREA